MYMSMHDIDIDICKYMYVCVHVNTCVCADIFTYIYVWNMHIYTCIYICICIYITKHIWTGILTRACVYTCVCVCLCVSRFASLRRTVNCICKYTGSIHIHMHFICMYAYIPKCVFWTHILCQIFDTRTQTTLYCSCLHKHVPLMVYKGFRKKKYIRVRPLASPEFVS